MSMAAATGAALALYALVVEPRWLQVRRPRIYIRGLRPELEGFRLGLISDLHAGGTSPAFVLRRAVSALCAARPDAIAVTGDLLDARATNYRALVPYLQGLRAPFGVFAVPGNHDYSAGVELWHAAVAAAGLQDLTNRSVVLPVRGARLCLAGLDDYGKGAPLLTLPPGEERDVTILLSHWPDAAEHVRRALDAVDLVVSGHTHGGQVRLPVLGPPYNPSGHRELYEDGVRRRPWTQVYVTRGVGTSGFRIRFGARPEVTILTLTGAPRPARRFGRRGG
jgi:uncharacterized protein